jgi:hypothetical protein
MQQSTRCDEQKADTKNEGDSDACGTHLGFLCSFIYDSRSWAGAGYVQGNVGGLFVFQPGCSGSGAEKAKRLLRSVVGMLPPVDGSVEFLEPPNHG